MDVIRFRKLKLCIVCSPWGEVLLIKPRDWIQTNSNSGPRNFHCLRGETQCSSRFLRVGHSIFSQKLFGNLKCIWLWKWCGRQKIKEFPRKLLICLHIMKSITQTGPHKNRSTSTHTCIRQQACGPTRKRQGSRVTRKRNEWRVRDPTFDIINNVKLRAKSQSYGHNLILSVGSTLCSDTCAFSM